MDTFMTWAAMCMPACAMLCHAEEGVALRGLFIIDKESVIQHATINNLAFGRNVDETLRILQVGCNAAVVSACELSALNDMSKRKLLAAAPCSHPQVVTWLLTPQPTSLRLSLYLCALQAVQHVQTHPDEVRAGRGGGLCAEMCVGREGCDANTCHALMLDCLCALWFGVRFCEVFVAVKHAFCTFRPSKADPGPAVLLSHRFAPLAGPPGRRLCARHQR